VVLALVLGLVVLALVVLVLVPASLISLDYGVVYL